MIYGNKARYRERQHLSFPRVIIPMGLVAISTLSLVGVLTGLNHVTRTISMSPQTIISLRGTSSSDDSRSNDVLAIHNESTDPRSNGEGVDDETYLAKFFMKNRRVIFLEHEGDWVELLRRKSDTTTKRVIDVSKYARREQDRLLDSEDFSYRDPLYEGECVPMTEWQTTSFPNCNMFHELDFHGKVLRNELEYFTSGGYNDIFYVNERDTPDEPEMALKILSYGTSYSDRNFDRVRRDGLILERLTKSPYSK